MQSGNSTTGKIPVYRAVLPNLFTLGNLFCGYLSIVNTINDNFATAAVLILVASVFDALDGKIARWTRSSSPFGAELDSICDVVSFGIAPSILVYRHELLDPPFGIPDFIAIAIAFLPALGGALRLARFNVVAHASGEHKNYFTGMPIPAAANTLSAYILFTSRVYDHPIMHSLVPLLLLALCLLMVSKVRYSAIPPFSWHQSIIGRIKLIYIIASLIALVLFQEIVFFPIMFLYLLSGFVENFLPDKTTD